MPARRLTVVPSSEIVEHTTARLPGTVTPVALILPDDLSHEQWLAAIETIKSIEQSRLWWWGDALNFGERKWGDMYEQALDVSNLAYSTLRNAKHVSGRFELYRRRHNLTWSHHQEVAHLDDQEQDRLLDEAERNGWSRKVLRTVIGQQRERDASMPRRRVSDDAEQSGRKGNDLDDLSHAFCIQTDELRGSWDDAALAMAVALLMQAAWQAPDAPEVGSGNPAAAAHETIGEMERWIARLRRGRSNDD